VMSGGDRRFRARLLRTGLTVAEPFYAATMRIRNSAYDRGVFDVTKLQRPTISVGNITTGGTGKTPMVRWLSERLLASGIKPAVLLRGYRAADKWEGEAPAEPNLSKGLRLGGSLALPDGS